MSSSANKKSLNLEIKAMSDFGAGYQGFSAKRTGELRSIAGTVTNVDLHNTELLVKLPKAFHPNHDLTFLAPFISEGMQWSLASYSSEYT